VRAEFDEDARWLVLYRGALRIVACLADNPVAVPAGQGDAEVEYVLVLGSDPGISVKPGVITMPPASFAVVEER
jgi:maltooligosyltrehalose trehalohydrolase